MPDEDYDDPDPDGEGDSSVIRDLRKKLKAKEAEASEVTELRKKLAMSEAKLDLNADQQTAILALLPPDEVTPENIREKAASLKWYDPEPEPQVSADEQAALQRVQEATAAALPADGQQVSLEDRIAQAKSPAEIEQIARDAGIEWNATDI